MYDVVAGASAGRPSVREGDLLRAAVVFLHATLEDLMRSIAKQRLPLASQEVLKQIPWPRYASSSKTALDLGDLVAFRGKTVFDVLTFAVDAYLERITFNHPGEVKQMLDWLDLGSSLIDPYKDEIGVMIARRHLIVHRTDQNENAGRGQHSARSISKSQVNRWLLAVERFGHDVLQATRSA
jgi:hypothetical protein